MKNQKGIGLLEVIIAALVFGVIVAGCMKILVDFNQTMRDNNERTAALYKLSSVMEVHRHSPHLVDLYTPVIMAGTTSVESFYLKDTPPEELSTRERYTAAIEWLNQYDGEMQSFSMTGSHIFGPRHLCISADCPKLEQPPVTYLPEEADKPPYNDIEDVTGITDSDDDLDNDDGYSTCKNGDNGFGNGDGYAPGNSGPNNNAANAGNPDREECEKTNGPDWKFPT